ncbi:hypothetical protein SAMN05428988_1493 [Chitinophaga sp. YR573]|uniref:hypothetical protein n=1 Tax=Chitinophaga sp. YR573 TaxID=1881040 RepID=UPI0008D308CC|nr:hypothetical protein [Chitinophaga sp. YR573]SEW03966.1 hypothetical protein SAMN05428988_1493 [Chitinophaga sp. YR573]
MKNAKIILTAIAVFAVVGGILAFKVQRFSPFQAFTSVGSIITSTTINGVVYTTIVPLCTTTALWFTYDGGFLSVVSSTTIKVLTGKSPIGLTTTWQELACTPTTTLVSLLL